MLELPSAQVLLLPPPPPSTDNPELCAELDDVGDHEFSCKATRGKKAFLVCLNNQSKARNKRTS